MFVTRITINKQGKHSPSDMTDGRMYLLSVNRDLNAKTTTSQ